MHIKHSRVRRLRRKLLMLRADYIEFVNYFDFGSIILTNKLSIADDCFPLTVGRIINIHKHVLVLKKSARVSVLRTAVDVKYDVGFPNGKVF